MIRIKARVIAVLMLFAKRYVFLLVAFFMAFFVCGLIIYLVVVPVSIMAYTELPTGLCMGIRLSQSGLRPDGAAGTGAG